LQDHSQNIIVRELPRSEDRDPLFIVGDVHGCAKELSELIKKAKEKISRFQLVLVGDLFTKGPDPVGVFELIHEHDAICIKGNHDWALWSSILQAQRRGVESLSEHSQQTLHLIRFHKRAVFELLSNLPHVLSTNVVPRVTRKQWEQDFPLTVVHAGIDPILGVKGSTERILLTARYVRWEHAQSEDKKLVVVPSGYRSEMMAQGNRLAMQSVSASPAAAGEFPNISQTQFHSVHREPHQSHAPAEVKQDKPGRAGSSEKFRWHELHHGPDLIVFGHDAKQGLFRKTNEKGRPICVGVDTGCTYGRALTGYFPEYDDAIQVPSKRVYFDIVRNVILIKGASAKVAV
jgi:bis(5'-nucleosyl)-tetraphosphatase (symmetrical)